MSRDEGRIYYAAHKGCYVFKLVGNVSQNTLQNQFDAINLADFIEKRFDAEQVDKVLIDLTEAHYIDSTHLGLLTQIAMAVRRNKGEAPTVVAPEGKIRRLLMEMGLQAIFHVISEADELVCANTPLPTGDEPVQSNNARVVLEAHRALAALNEKNRDTFKNVITLLEKQQV